MALAAPAAARPLAEAGAGERRRHRRQVALALRGAGGPVARRGGPRPAHRLAGLAGVPRMARDRRGRRPGGADRRDRPVAGTFFYYVGDNPESFIPLWHKVGAALREGSGWASTRPRGPAGNLVGEAAYGMFNPVTLANTVLISGSTTSRWLPPRSWWSSSRSSRWARTCWPASTAPVVPAVIVAMAIPVTGFTLWYEASGWPGYGLHLGHPLLVVGAAARAAG